MNLSMGQLVLRPFVTDDIDDFFSIFFGPAVPRIYEIETAVNRWETISHQNGEGKA